ncbi:MAG: iron ABC transporter permease [Armatimonadota bacterium]|nr:iron ABC transporter permease [Armatimonadota bacterium]
MDTVLPVRRTERLSGAGRAAVIVGVTGLVAYLTLVPLGFLIYGSFFTPGVGEQPGIFTVSNYLHAYTDRSSLPVLKNSVVFAAGTAATAFCLGTGLAWITERTDTPLSGLHSALSLVPLIVPGILFSLSWIFLFSPRIGLINLAVRRAFGLTDPLFNVYSLAGMVWVEGLHWSPLAFLLMTAAFRSMDPALEESALMSGASPRATFFRITLKLAMPTTLSVMLLLFLRGIETFEVPAIIGLPVGIHVFTSKIYLAVKGYPSDLGLAGAYSTLLLAMSLLGIFIHARVTGGANRFATVTGRGAVPRRIALGRWRYLTAAVLVGYLGLAVVLPLLVLVWYSLLPYYLQPSVRALDLLTVDSYRAVLTLPAVRRAAANTLLLALASATAVMLLTAVVAWITVRTRPRGRWLVDQMASLPVIFPGVVMGVALSWAYLRLPVPIYGTLWILLLAYVTRYLPYGVRASSSALLRIHTDLEGAAQMSGASWLQLFWRILFPLMRSGLVAGWIYVVVVSVRELSSSLLLWSPGNEVLSVVMFDLWQSGHPQEVAALGVLLAVVLTGAALVFRRVAPGG